MNKYLGASGRKRRAMIWTAEKHAGTQSRTFHRSWRPSISLENKILRFVVQSLARFDTLAWSLGQSFLHRFQQSLNRWLIQTDRCSPQSKNLTREFTKWNKSGKSHGHWSSNLSGRHLHQIHQMDVLSHTCSTRDIVSLSTVRKETKNHDVCTQPVQETAAYLMSNQTGSLQQ